MSVKDIVEKAKSYDDLIESLKHQPIQPYMKEDSHLKGYIFDSLVYRYKLAREQAMQYELIVAKKEDSYCKEKAIRHMANRDVMRFIEILEEAMGEHD